MPNIAIVSSLVGNRERVCNPTVIHSNADYFMFTDQPTNNTVWQKMDVYKFSNDSRFADRRNAKVFKILPELFIKNYSAYIWVDISHDVVADPQHIVDNYLKYNNFAVFRHTQRNCVYEEAKILKELNYDHHENIDRQMNFYRSIGYPENNGLYELSTFVKRNDHLTTTISLKWWDHICRYASRDQLSFPVSVREMCGNISILPGFANGYNSSGGIGNNPLMPQTRVHVGSG